MMTSYKWCVRVRVVLNLVLALYILLRPDDFVKLLRLESETDPAWVQAFAIAVIFLTMAYIPSTVAPLKARSTNVFILVGPILPIILLFWLGWSDPNRGFLWLAAYELIFAILLGSTFKRGWIAELMKKP